MKVVWYMGVTEGVVDRQIGHSACDRATSQVVRVMWCDISDRDVQDNMCVMMCYHTHDKKQGLVWWMSGM